MQMKIVVDTPEDYAKWLKSKTTVVKEVKAEKAVKEAPAEGVKAKDTVLVAPVMAPKVAMK
jgi:heme/copper-type cytochrome/quinol oxidase subunit 2